jgi:sec-independent protein translocase protein TatB
MFDLGSWGEFLIIVVVALIVIKPQDIPRALKMVGRIITKIRSFVSNFQIDFEKALQNIEQEEFKNSLDALHAPIDLNQARKSKQQDDKI